MPVPPISSVKTLHLSIIAILLLSITFVPPSVQGMTGSALFMKTNSTAKIYTNFTFYAINNETLNLTGGIYSGVDGSPNPIDSKNMTIVAEPSHIRADKNNVPVTYTITAKNNTKGVYALSVYFCGLQPLVVGLNESQVSPAVFDKYFTAVYNCPMESSSTPTMKVAGYSGIISKLITVNANNTITAYPQNTSSPNNSYQPPIPPPPVALNQSLQLPPPPPALHIPIYPSPLEQFKTGTAANRIQCNDGLQLVIKSEDGTPACVKSDTAQKLAERGWNLPETYDSPSLVQFYFSINSSVIHVGQTIGVDMGDNNTQARPIKLPFSYGYSFRASSLSPCDYGPYRIAVFEGNVAMEDLNNTEPLHFYQPGDYSCYPVPGKFWIFEPSSNTAALDCHLGMNCNDTRSNSHLSFNGYWDDKAHFHLLDKGNYTIFASDEWGHTAVHHFTVTNSTISNGLQTSQIVPQCVSNIPHPYAIAGPPGLPLCPVASFQASGHIVNSTGFYGIYNYTKFPDTQNFVLEPGHNATITYKISAGAIHSWASTTPSNEINLTNYVTLMHDAGMHDHPGVYVSVYPTSETIQQNGSAIITITLSASKNASYGTYWMQLPPGICFGGEEIILTVTDCTEKK